MGLLDSLFPGTNTTAWATPLGLPPVVQPNPFAQWFDQNQQKIVGGFTGLANSSPNDPRGILTGLVNGVQQGAPADMAKQQAMQQEAKAAEQVKQQQDQQNRTIQWLQQHAPKYADAVANGVMTAPDAWKAAQTDQGGGPGVFDGTSMDAQVGNILLKGDPNSPEYAYAYSIAKQPKITMQQTPQGLVPVYQTPDLSSVRPPTYQGSLAPASGTAPGPAATQPSGGGLPPMAGLGAPDGGLSPAIGGLQAGNVIPGTKPKPTETDVRNTLLSAVISPDAMKLVGGDGQPGTFDALTRVPDQLRNLGGDAALAVGQGPAADFQRAKNSIKSIVASYLYIVSGATANPGEVATQTASLIPKMGEAPASVADKKARLLTYVNAVRAAAGLPPIGDPTSAAAPSVGASPVIDLGNGVTIQQVSQ